MQFPNPKSTHLGNCVWAYAFPPINKMISKTFRKDRNGMRGTQCFSAYGSTEYEAKLLN